jgi:TM2 domain-containing membrane protein YozV
VVAALLSAVVPGAGHIYAGHYGDGVTSFFLNGLFIAGTVVAIRQENYAVAGAVGVVGLPFYIGNIYGAANAATKWNISIRKVLRGAIAVTLDSPF